MITTLTALTAHTAMQMLLPKTTPRYDANFQVSEEAKMEANGYRSIAARLGLGEGQAIAHWPATRHIINGNRTALVEVEMTESDRNLLIALLEKELKEKEESLVYHRQTNSVSNVVLVFQSLVEVLNSSIKELSEKTIQE